MSFFTIDTNIDDISSVEDVERILTHLRDVISSTQRQLAEQHVDLLPHFKNGVVSLPFVVSGDESGDNPSQEGEPAKEDSSAEADSSAEVDSSAKADSSHRHISAPHIECFTELPWGAFPDLIAEALRLGAEKAGGFLVTLDPSTPGHSWIGSDRAIQCQKSRLKYIAGSNGNGAYQIEIDADERFRFNLSEIKSWPAHPVNPSLVALQFDRFDSQLLDARKRRDAYVAPPYAINKDAGTRKEREALGLQSSSPLIKIKRNRLEHTRTSLPGIHSPEAFVSTMDWGSPFGVHVEDFYLNAINYHVCGAPKLWCLIPEKYAAQFEKLMAKINKRDRKCDQFVRHDYTWPTRDVLNLAGIRYTLIYQQEHQAVVTLRHVYHWGFNMGANIAEAVNYAGDEFTTEGDDSTESTDRGAGHTTLVPQKRPSVGSSKEMTVRPSPRLHHQREAHTHGTNMVQSSRAYSTTNTKGKGHLRGSRNAREKDHSSGPNNTREKDHAGGLSNVGQSDHPLYERVTERLSKELERHPLSELGLTEAHSTDIVRSVCGIGSPQGFVKLQEVLRQYRSFGQSLPAPLGNSFENQDAERIFARKFLDLINLGEFATYAKLQGRFQLLEMFNQTGPSFAIQTQSTMALGIQSSSLRSSSLYPLVDKIIAEAKLAKQSIGSRATIYNKLHKNKVLASRFGQLVDEYDIGFLLLIPLVAVPDSYSMSDNSDAQFVAFRVLLRTTRVDWIKIVSAALSGIAREISNNLPLSATALEMEVMEPETVAGLQPNSDELLDIVRLVSLVE
ncbi:hypothetical protein MMC17_003022 [Xylographa soralifera]|nr:hypothetical protein [Xylographa soralifera]